MRARFPNVDQLRLIDPPTWLVFSDGESARMPKIPKKAPKATKTSFSRSTIGMRIRDRSSATCLAASQRKLEWAFSRPFIRAPLMHAAHRNLWFLHATGTIRRLSIQLGVKQSDMATFTIQKSSRGQFYYIFRGGNGEPVMTGEEHPSKQRCESSIDAVKRNAPLDHQYSRWETAGQYHFNLKGGNGERLGTSEAYTTSAARENGIGVVKREAPAASVDDRS